MPISSIGSSDFDPFSTLAATNSSAKSDEGKVHVSLTPVKVPDNAVPVWLTRPATSSGTSPSAPAGSGTNQHLNDPDFAAAIASATKKKILEDAGLASLSQANAKPQNALSLLK